MQFRNKLMYGKIFASMFTGSMMGAGGHVHSTMVYAIANADESGFVELNPGLLAVVIGEPHERIDKAITYLCAPDTNSRTPDEEGRRLVQEGQFLYRIVNYGKYRAVRDKETRRRQTREAVQRYREKKKRANLRNHDVNGCKQGEPDVSACKPRKPKKAQAEAEAEEYNPPIVPPGGDAGGGCDLFGEPSDQNPPPRQTSANGESFERFWQAYPRKVAKAATRKAWTSIDPTSDQVQQIVDSVERHKLTDQWQRDDGKFIPHPATFLNQRRFEDEISDADLARDADGNPIIPGAFYSPSGKLVSRPPTPEEEEKLIAMGIIAP
jgi:hypothetical protein